MLSAHGRFSFLPIDISLQFSGVKGAKGCFSYRAGSLWPYKLITHLLTQAVHKGVNLQTNTPVLQVSESPDTDGLWTVRTPRGSIKAKYIVFASNAYTSAIVPEYQSKIIPVRGICSRIVVPNQPNPPLKSSYTLRFNSWKYDYLIPRPDGSIVVGGARSSYLHNLDSWYNNTDDNTLIETASQYFDNYMQRNFDGWENSGAYTDRVWTGSKYLQVGTLLESKCSFFGTLIVGVVMGYTTDSLPHVGRVPKKQGQLVIAGFNGHGMPQIFLSAKGVAQMILKGVEFEDTGLPRLFKTTQERLESKENKILDPFYIAEKAQAQL